MNKKGDLLGGEMMMWIYRFMLLGFVVFAYTAIIFNFYSIRYDIRSPESMFIGKKVIDCVSEGGIINRDIVNKETISKCLNFKNGENEIYIDFNLIDINGDDTYHLYLGKEELKPLCEYGVYCSRQKYYFLTDDYQKAKLELFIAIDKTEENV